MEYLSLLIQFGGSLLAIVALYWLARAMGLGGTTILNGKSAVVQQAEQIADGFAAEHSAIANDGSCALAENAKGQIMVIKRHGNRFAGRILTSTSKATLNNGTIEIDCGEQRFGVVTLNLDSAEVWADKINGL